MPGDSTVLLQSAIADDHSRIRGKGWSLNHWRMAVMLTGRSWCGLVDKKLAVKSENQMLHTILSVHMHSHDNQEDGIPCKNCQSYGGVTHIRHQPTASVVSVLTGGPANGTHNATRRRRLKRTSPKGKRVFFVILSWRVGLWRPHTDVRVRLFLRRLRLGFLVLALPWSCSLSSRPFPSCSCRKAP